MKICLSILFWFIVSWSVDGFAQLVTPTITLGTHVVSLGMPETTVLEQLGTDLRISHPDSSGPTWMVTKKVGETFILSGFVSFENHKLSTAVRTFETKETSSRSLFYAINTASRNLERDGLTNCQLSTTNDDYPVEGGSVSESIVQLDCGIKKIKITSSVADAPGVVSGIRVTEWLQRK